MNKITCFIIVILLVGCKTNNKVILSNFEQKIIRMDPFAIDSLQLYITTKDNYQDLIVSSKKEDTIIFNINNIYSYNEETIYNVLIAEETEKIKIIFRCNIPNQFVTDTISLKAKTRGLIVPSSNFYIKDNKAYVEAIMAVNCNSIISNLSSARKASITIYIEGDNPIHKTFYVFLHY